MAVWLNLVRALVIGVSLTCLSHIAAQPEELDDSFLEKKGEFSWLIEFYAPWCGHCRRLEPIYHQVWMELRNTPIKVVKVDATRYSSLGSEFDVHGFPTIKFVQGDRIYTHRGDRSKDGIVEFAKRAYGPPVRPISNMGKFTEIRGEHRDGVWFMYIGQQEAFSDLMTKYTSIAEKYCVLGYFYAGETRVAPEEVQLTYDPTIVVFKDGKYFEYDPPPGEATKKTLDNWVNGERYPAFPKMTGGALNEMTELPKKLVVIVTNDTERDNIRTIRFKDVGKILAEQHRDQYNQHFQFMWMGDSETMNNIMMTTLELPNVVVLDPNNQMYYLPPFTSQEMTQDLVASFLQEVMDERSPAYGGTGITQRFKRLLYDIVTTVWSIYETSGWLALLVFGVPSFVISIVCYALCCMEPGEEGLEERDEDEEYLQQQGQIKEAGGTPGEPLTEDSKEEADDDGHIKKE